MKQELIKKIFNEFEKDKKLIKSNLLETMDIIILEVKDKYGKITMTIKYERREKNKNKQ